MNIGIVTTWFERGAAYVSKQFEEVLSEQHSVFIYARGGEKYAIGNPKWDKENVHWGKKRKTPFESTSMNKKDFVEWVKKNKIEKILFNEQQWFIPLLWCDELKIPTIAYIDYYKKNTLPLFNGYSALICNTKRHHSVFEWHTNACYVPWGTNTELYKPSQEEFKLNNPDFVSFFHSTGYAPIRKGTDILLKAANNISEAFHLIIHTQVDLIEKLPELKATIEELLQKGKLEIINQTVPAPGLYHRGDVYVYPSRLDGIGLTVAESQACGNVPVVTNNGPMNEFVPEGLGYLIDVERFYSREDGYYWPECTPSENHLSQLMTTICQNKEKIPALKKKNRDFAIEQLNWNKNAAQLNDLIEKIQYRPLNLATKKEIRHFENTDIRKLNSLYLQFFFVFNFIRKLFKK